MATAEDKVNHDDTVQAEVRQTVQVKDKRILPEGVVPKQAQAYVIAGLALLILLAVLFSKNHARTVPRETTPATSAIANNANQQQIRELEQNLNADQRRSEQQPAQSTAQRAAATNTPDGTGASSGSSIPQTQSPAQSPRNEIVNAEKALAFKARFASNLVAPATQTAATHTNTGGGGSHALNQHGSALKPEQQRASGSLPAASGKGRSKEVNIDAAHGRPYVIFEGTTIDTVLTNRLDSDFAGPVKVMVTNPVYSRDGQHVLIPAGTFILGDTKKVGSMGQSRLAVTFHRMIMPDGYSVDLDQFHGLDQIGDAGLTDRVNHHYLRIFGASIALGLVAGAAESSTYGGYTTSGSDMYRQGVASSLSQSSSNVLDRFINILPTITIREGTRIRIYLTQDLLLPAYSDHEMPGVM
jgi:type IV secretion system protein VirB10